MPQNPLLPNRKLRELYALMLRCRDLDRRQPNPAAREALLAATTMQLLPGDMLSVAPGDRAAALAPASKSDAKPSATTPAEIAPRLVLCAATARGLQAAAAQGILLSLTTAGSAEPGWAAALTWANTEKLPLLLAVADATDGKASVRKQSEPLNWLQMQRLAKKMRLPVFAVDGEDAVAVYRVMQESALRARAGDGPAVIWAVLNPHRPAPAQQPLARLRSYLAARRIALRP